MPSCARSARIRSASAKSRCFLASARAAMRASIRASPSPWNQALSLAPSRPSRAPLARRVAASSIAECGRASGVLRSSASSRPDRPAPAGVAGGAVKPVQVACLGDQLGRPFEVAGGNAPTAGEAKTSPLWPCSSTGDRDDVAEALRHLLGRPSTAAVMNPVAGERQPGRRSGSARSRSRDGKMRSRPPPGRRSFARDAPRSSPSIRYASQAARG